MACARTDCRRKWRCRADPAMCRCGRRARAGTHRIPRSPCTRDPRFRPRACRQRTCRRSRVPSVSTAARHVNAESPCRALKPGDRGAAAECGSARSQTPREARYPGANISGSATSAAPSSAMRARPVGSARARFDSDSPGSATIWTAATLNVRRRRISFTPPASEAVVASCPPEARQPPQRPPTARRPRAT